MDIVSVVIPVKDGEKFLSKTLDSVLNQSYKYLEILIIDNASTDNTECVIEEYKSKDTRIKSIKNSTSKSIHENFTLAVNNSSGKYLKILCADDLILVDCISKQVKVLEEFPNVSLCSGNKQVINEAGKILLKNRGFSKYSGVFDGRQAVLMSLLKGTNLLEGTFASLTRTAIAKKIMPFDEQFSYLMDFDYCFKILQFGNFYNLNEILGQYRVHVGSLSKSLKFNQLYEWYQFLNLNLNKLLINSWVTLFRIKLTILIMFVLRTIFIRIRSNARFN